MRLSSFSLRVRWAAVAMVAVVAIDWTTKQLARHALATSGTTSILDQRFYLGRVEHAASATAFTIPKLALVLLGLSIAVAVVPTTGRFWVAVRLGAGAAAGGLLSNDLERLFDGAGTDFLGLQIGPIDGLTNFADVALVIGLTVAICAFIAGSISVDRTERERRRRNEADNCKEAGARDDVGARCV